MPVGPGREVEFQIPVLVGCGGMDDEPVPAGTLEVVFQRPVLLGYHIEDEPVPAVGLCVYVVAFQIPVLLRYDVDDKPVPALGPCV